MKSVVLLAALILSACVATSPEEGGPAVRQEASWPRMGLVADTQGNYSSVPLGDQVPTVIVSGADDFDQALTALSAFCGITADPMAWDTQFVYRDPANGDYWFDGLCG